MSATDRVSNLSLQKQIELIDTRLSQLCEGIGEIKAMLQNIEARVRKLETEEAGMHPVIETRISAAWRRLDEHEQKLASLTTAIVRLEQANRVLSWIGGILGSTVIVWLITQLLRVVK